VKLSHMDERGRSVMVDIGEKAPSTRTARAEGRLFVSPETVRLVRDAGLPKGNPFEVARYAGIQAAKRTADLIPLCHSLSLDFVDVEIELGGDGFLVRSIAKCRWATGVEMEALTAAAAALLTLYDMCKAVDSAMRIGDIRLVEKTKTSR
jgi:cyclic pyranopterin monophosphate synthase